MIRGFLTRLSLVAGLPLLLAATALAQDEDGAFDRTPQDCITTTRIDQTEVIDDQNILFRMRGDAVYRNTLPRKCPGLEREGRIGYKTSTSRLCDIDTITVLEDFGAGFRPGFTCRLGQFVPLSPADIEELEFREDGEAGQSAIETSSVEVERDEESEASDGGEAAPDEDAADESSEDNG